VWALIEPGIELGSEVAMAQANMWLRNRHLADAAFFRQAGLIPQGEVVFGTHRDCIGQKIGTLAQGNFGPLAPTMTWFEAVSICQGGDSSAPPRQLYFRLAIL
jgi:hypothetical protein